MVKPIHPAAVHFPIAFLFLGFGLDIAHQLRSSLPAAITSNLPISSELTRASYFLITIGLASMIPAIITGGAEAVKMFSKGIYEADGKTIRPKIKATIAHAVFNDVVLALTAYSWYQRRTAAKESLAGKMGVEGVVATPEAAYAPKPLHVGIEAAALVLLGLASNIGGTLTYNFGVGFASASSGKKTQ